MQGNVFGGQRRVTFHAVAVSCLVRLLQDLLLVQVYLALGLSTAQVVANAFVQWISLCEPNLSPMLKRAIAHFRNAPARETPIRLFFPQFVLGLLFLICSVGTSMPGFGS